MVLILPSPSTLPQETTASVTSFGVTPNRCFYRQDVYDLATRSWFRGQDMPVGMHGISPVYAPLSDVMVVAAGGGDTSATPVHKSNWFFYQYKA